MNPRLPKAKIITPPPKRPYIGYIYREVCKETGLYLKYEIKKGKVKFFTSSTGLR